MSSGIKPLLMSSANRLQSNRRKYSCLEYDKKLLESVSIPTKQLIKPIFDRVFSCWVMPSSWSRNHHPEPNCILPLVPAAWKFPIMAANTALSAGLRLYTTVLAKRPSSSSILKKCCMDCACRKSPMESYPVSAPSSRNLRLLVLRSGPRWNCCTHPLSWYNLHNSESTKEVNASSCSAARVSSPVSTRLNTSSNEKLTSICRGRLLRPWSAIRQPWLWK